MGVFDILKGLISESNHIPEQIFYHGKELVQRDLGLSFDPDQETTIYFHGYGARGRSLEHIARGMHRVGYNAILFTYPFLDDLEDVALEGVKKVREIYAQQSSDRPVHIISHSMGGLVSCDVTKMVPELVSTTTFLGTPFSGLKKARYGIGKSAQQLCPGSTYLHNLLKDGLPENIEYHLVQGKYDLVVSRENGDLPLEQDNIHRYLLKTSHLGLTGEKGFRLVRRLLREKINQK